MIVLITALTALGSISVSIYLPSLPSIGASLHAGDAAVRGSVTLFFAVFALMQLVYGPLSDRFGRRAPIIAGLVWYGAGSLICALAPSITVLLVGRAVQAIGAAAGPALGRAVIRDQFSGPDLAAALAVVTAAVALSPMLGPFAGGLIDTRLGWHAIFWVLAGVAAVLLAAIARWLPETLAHADPHSTRPDIVATRYARLLADREFLSAVLCAGFLTAGNFAWNAMAPFVFATRFHLAADQYGMVSLVVGLGYLGGTLSVPWLARHLDPARMVYGGLALALIAALALQGAATLAAGALQLALPMIFYTLGMGIVVPSAAACALSRFPTMAGAAAGMLGALQIMTGAVGTAMASFIPGGSTGWLVVLIVSATMLAAGFGWSALAPLRAQEAD